MAKYLFSTIHQIIYKLRGNKDCTLSDSSGGGVGEWKGGNRKPLTDRYKSRSTTFSQSPGS
jgi:hypothetical protein